MGDNTLTTIAEPATVEVADGNQFFTALVGDSIPRDTSTGAPEDNVHKLGRLAFRWKEAHITDLFLGGSLFDPDALGVDVKFSINAGATRTDSEQPDFLRADGTGANATILATATDFQITANNTSVTISSDIAITSLTVAPSSNNTALVNDTDLAGGNNTKFTGEDVGDSLIIDTVGSEITDRIGEFICLKTPTGEFMFAFVEDATTLNRCYRGFFFDDNGDPVVRGVLSNNNTLTLMSLGWVFLDNNGTTVDVSYTSPIYSGVEPPSPVTDDYWFDLKNILWKRFDGSTFEQVDRMLIGLLVIDETNCVAARSFDFTKSYDDFIDLQIEIKSVTEIRTQLGYSRISVYGKSKELYAGEFIWDITSDLETGVSESASTTYFIYVTEEGIPIISDEKPFDRESELRGFYHPYHSWRFVGEAFNDSSSDLTKVDYKSEDSNSVSVGENAVAFTGTDITYTIGASAPFTPVAEVLIPLNGSVRVSYDLRDRDASAGSARGQLFLNGVATGAEGIETSATFIDITRNINVKAGDKIRLDIRHSQAGAAQIRNFEIKISETGIHSFPIWHRVPG